MYPGAATQAYDRAITIFSPDGRLFQVEYARVAVKRGTTAVGIVYGDGVLLAADKNVTSKLMKGESIEKIYKLDAHIGAATSGLVADARRLIDFARYEAQEEQITYQEPIEIETLTKRISDVKQYYTQWGGARPFGAALIIVGVDDTGPRLFDTDPSGAIGEWTAVAIGSGKQEAEEVFEKDYKESLNLEEAIELALKALKQVGDKKVTIDTVEMAYVPVKTRKYTKLTESQLSKYIGPQSKKK